MISFLLGKLFQCLYIHQNNGTAIGSICSSAVSGILGFLRENDLKSETFEMLDLNGISEGQLMFLLQMCRYDKVVEVFYEIILYFVEHRWKTLPYHLRMSLLEAIPFCYSQEEQRLLFVGLLHTIHSTTQDFQLKNSIMEALLALSAFDNEEENMFLDIRESLKTILTSPEDQSRQMQAFGIYDAQTDPFFDHLYFRSIHELSEAEQQIFYLMALRGMGSYPFGFSLIFKAIDTNGGTCCRYLIKYIEHIELKTGFPSKDLSLFFLVHVVLGRYSYELPDFFASKTDPDQKNIYAMGNIFYHLNGYGQPEAKRNESCRPFLSYLESDKSKSSMDTIYQARILIRDFAHSEFFKSQPLVGIWDKFPGAVSKICRASLLDLPSQREIIHVQDHKELGRHAIALLGQCGSLTDIPLLRSLSDDLYLGEAAISAIRDLQKY